MNKYFDLKVNRSLANEDKVRTDKELGIALLFFVIALLAVVLL